MVSFSLHCNQPAGAADRVKGATEENGGFWEYSSPFRSGCFPHLSTSPLGTKRRMKGKWFGFRATT